MNSDLSFERFKVTGSQTLMDLHPYVQFYDYTKVYNRLDHKVKNLHLTFSFSGSNEKNAGRAQLRGVNVAYVFKDKLPKRHNGLKVINGDVTIYA